MKNVTLSIFISLMLIFAACAAIFLACKFLSCSPNPEATYDPGHPALFSAYEPLKNLPADYSTLDAVSDGCFVRINALPDEQSTWNDEVVTGFINTVRGETYNEPKPWHLTGTPAFLRAVAQTIEGDLIITDFYYDGEKFIVTRDTTRDKFGPTGITTATYKHLHSLPFKPNEFYLSDNPQFSEDDLEAGDYAMLPVVAE